jgi:hypothetical protein
MLEKNGVRIAALSYDSQAILRGFSEEHGIGFPLLSDHDSAVIRRFGIFNRNIAPDLRAHGVPHPVEYLVAPDGIVIRKYFVANYQHRVTASSVVLQEFGAASDAAPVTLLRSGALTVEVGLSSAQAFAGQQISFFARFMLDAGWHVDGASITFDDPKIIRQTFELTQPIEPHTFQGLGSLLLRFPLDAGKTQLSGQLHFQQCSDTVCEAPEAIRFALPLTIEVFMDAERKSSVPPSR